MPDPLRDLPPLDFSDLLKELRGIRGLLEKLVAAEARKISAEEETLQLVEAIMGTPQPQPQPTISATMKPLNWFRYEDGSYGIRGKNGENRAATVRECEAIQKEIQDRKRR